MVEKNDVSLETQDSVDVKRNEFYNILHNKKWVKKPLKEIVQLNKTKYDPKYEHMEYKCIELEHLSQDSGILLGYTSSKNQKSIKNRFKKDMILFGKLRPYLNKFWFTEFEGVCSTEIWVLTTNEFPKFVFYLIQTSKFLNIANVTSGTKMPRSDWNFMKNVEFNIPDYQTQEIIADFLSLIDKKIEFLEKTLVLYEKIEKHYIKKIYNNISDGEKISLKNIFNVDSSNLSINSLEENNGKYKLYGAEGVIKTIDFYEKMEPYISIIKDGAGVGRLNLCDAYSSSLGTLQNLVPKENFDINFLYFYLKTLNFQKYIVGSTIPHIYFKDYSKEKLSIPNIEKQKNIGNFFIYFEKRNILLNNKIGCLTNFKKYLLQNMFI